MTECFWETSKATLTLIFSFTILKFSDDWSDWGTLQLAAVMTVMNQYMTIAFSESTIHSFFTCVSWILLLSYKEITTDWQGEDNAWIFVRFCNWTYVLKLYYAVIGPNIGCFLRTTLVVCVMCYCSRELQWQQLNALYENLCIKPADGSRDQLLYLSLVCFMRSLYQYASGTEMPQNCAGKCAVYAAV